MDTLRIFFHVGGMAITPEVLATGSLGGSETSGIYFARELARRGHEVVLFAHTPDRFIWEDVRVSPIGPQSQQFQLGELFEKTALFTPHDVLIIQRIPSALPQPWAAKQIYVWNHDIARKRATPMIHANAWRRTGMFAVSEWHKNQICEAYGLPKHHVHVLRNALPMEHYLTEPDWANKTRNKTICYISRPERGLENLVKPGGIMEKLYEQDPEILLLVAHYDHTVPEIEAEYERIWKMCFNAPNVQMVGSLSKAGVAELMRDSLALVYPTVPERQHEETSCVAVMEALGGGAIPIVCAGGAVPETLRHDGQNLGITIPYRKDGSVDEDAFVAQVLGIIAENDLFTEVAKKERLIALKKYDWALSAEAFESVVSTPLRGSAPASQLLNALIENGDGILAHQAAENISDTDESRRVVRLMPLFDFTGDSAEYRRHYDRSAELFIGYGGGEFVDPSPSLNSRYAQATIPFLEKLTVRDEATVLDYGCNLGKLTMAWARLYPMIQFVGVDIAQANIDIARKKAKEFGLTNVVFERVSDPLDVKGRFDLICCFETLEHVQEDVGVFVDQLEALANINAAMVISVPSTAPAPYDRTPGEEERMEHVRFLEHGDVHELFGHKLAFAVQYYPEPGMTPMGQLVGGQFMSWIIHRDVQCGKIDIERKLRHLVPRQTLSVCIILKKSSPTIERLLKSISEIADEIVIGIDPDSADPRNVILLLKDYDVTYFDLSASPLKQGFAAARNETLKHATMDWILWVDDDEILQHPRNLIKYLRDNLYMGYAIHQHHLSGEPAGLIKTDLPCRLFRNHKGVEFFGMVHEHPELEMNKGLGDVFLIDANDVAIIHDGYQTESVRRSRFKRNYSLIEQDREKNPSRKLGKMLWVRDLAHMNRFEFEATHVITDAMRARAEEGIAIWREILNDKDMRLATDALPYLTELTDLLHGANAIAFEVSMRSQKMGIGDDFNNPPGPVQAKFPTAADCKKFSELLHHERFKSYEERYF